MPSVYGAEEYRPDALAMHHLHASARSSWYSGLHRLAELLPHLLHESPTPSQRLRPHTTTHYYLYHYETLPSLPLSSPPLRRERTEPPWGLVG